MRTLFYRIYLKDGLGKRYNQKWLKPVSAVLAVLFCCFAILASFGIGNMAQINKIVLNMDAAFFSGVEISSIPCPLPAPLGIEDHQELCGPKDQKQGRLAYALL